MPSWRHSPSGELAVLVATTVIEVGVDVPNATLMIVEGAERFGLAQLHQLRGRVGRGRGASRCLLLRGQQLSETGSARLALMRETNDGFRIAEEDLRLRGPGEILGTTPVGRAELPASPRRRMSPNWPRSPRATPGCCSTATAASPASAARRRGCALSVRARCGGGTAQERVDWNASAQRSGAFRTDCAPAFAG